MKIDYNQKDAVIGIVVALSTQELIALKDKYEEIEDIMFKHDDDREKNSMKANRVTIEELTPILGQMSVFINRLTTGIQSSNEVHDDLFTSDVEKTVESGPSRSLRF